MSSHALPLRYASLTVVAALLTLSLKFSAAWLTGSVGLLSDALESIVNLVTSVLLVVLLRIAQSPPDHDHPHGHDKAEYFANGVQGALILTAGGGILLAAAERLLAPRPLEVTGLAVGLAVLAGLINVGTAGLLARAGKAARSQALQGEAQHLMTDVWTSLAVLLGVGLATMTGQHWLDPLIAVVMSVLIFVVGGRLLRQSVSGLMDASVSPETRSQVVAILEDYVERHQIAYHALRTRIAGPRIFVSLHVLVPGSWSVRRGHELLHEIELRLQEALPGASVLTHLEPIEEAISFEDIDL